MTPAPNPKQTFLSSQEGPKRLPGGSPEAPQRLPGSPQEAPRRPQKAPAGPRSPRKPQEVSIDPQEAPRRPQEQGRNHVVNNNDFTDPMFNKSSVQKRNIMQWRKKNDDFTNRSIKAAVRTAEERITTVKIMIGRTLCSIQAASRNAK